MNLMMIIMFEINRKQKQSYLKQQQQKKHPDPFSSLTGNITGNWG